MECPMKILLSAYACSAEAGSEPRVGFQAMLAAARDHDVWVLTQPDMAVSLERFLQHHPLRDRIHLEAIDPPAPAQQGGVRELARTHWRHDKWQRNAAGRSLELDRHVNFDVVHHVTLAAFWLRVGVAVVNKPLVWGPVGGAVKVPWPLVTELGRRGIAESGLRMIVRPVAGRIVRSRIADSAAVIFVQNQDTARQIRPFTEPTVLPNAIAVGIESMPHLQPRTKEIAFVGRFAPWKAGRLAVRAMRYVDHPDAVLHLYGSGGEQQSILEAARRWRVAHRVCFEGQLGRGEVLERVARAGVLLHPALHEEASFAIGEALMMGTPVVCLDHGGPVELIRQWPSSPSVKVAPGRPGPTARAFARAIDHFLDDPPPVPDTPIRPLDSFGDSMLDAYARAAAQRQR
jgi:glycosyltransferase involved in cell wall biosynthesis